MMPYQAESKRLHHSLGAKKAIALVVVVGGSALVSIVIMTLGQAIDTGLKYHDYTILLVCAFKLLFFPFLPHHFTSPTLDF